MTERRTRTVETAPYAPTRVDFRAGEFDAAVAQHGNRLLWERSAICPCQNHEQGLSPKVDCPVCDGLGWEFWGDQVVYGIAVGLDFHADTQVAYGMWASGLARITVRAEHAPSLRDRYTNLDTLIRFSERRERRAEENEFERLRYYIGIRTYKLHGDMDVVPEVFRGLSPLERAAELGNAEVRARFVASQIIGEEVTRLRVMNDDRTPGRVLIQGRDFEVVNGLIDWSLGDVAGTAPVLGQAFVATYNFHPRYTITSFEHVARAQTIVFNSGRPEGVLTQLPVEVQAKLDFLREDDRG